MDALPWLDPFNLDFPPVDQACTEPNGLLAAGGDLSVERLVAAYSQGIFPWFEDDQPILWWSPDPRAVIWPQNLKISRSLKKVIRRQTFKITVDTAFTDVIEACSGPRRASMGTWITQEMKAAYIDLHKRNIAHSVEAWQDGQLVGGLYGVALGRLYFGESMFSHVADASKVAFAYLVHNLSRCGFPFIDCQVPNDHLTSLGASPMPRAEYLDLLRTHSTASGNLLQSPWHIEWTMEI